MKERILSHSISGNGFGVFTQNYWGGVIFELLILIILYFEKINWPEFGMFAFGQMTIFQFWTPDSLRGYGVGTPNGSLWTIGILIQFYLLVWFGYRILHGKKAKVHLIVFLALLCISIISTMLEGYLPEIAMKLYNQTLIPYLWIFHLGIVFAEFSKVLLSAAKKYWWLFVAFTYACIIIDKDIPASYPVFFHLFQIFAVMGIAYSFPKLEIKTDISYGLYLYHMTVVNIMVHFGLVGKIMYLFIALACSCLLAYLSTAVLGRLARQRKSVLIA